MQNGILLAGLFLSLAITLIAIPSIITVALSKGLYGISREKAGKLGKVPTLGGLAIFGGILIPLSLFSSISVFPQLPYLTAGILILFFIGIKDDILIIAPWWKLLGQIIVALAISIPGELRIDDPGVFINAGSAGTAFEILVTVLFIVVIINSFNLIDGIDGLASGIGLMASVLFGIVFYQYGLNAWTLIAAVSVGSLTGFAWYNVFSRKNKIYMGDTGSLIIGFVLALMAIKFLNMENRQLLNCQIKTPMAFVFAILIVPLFDTMRIIILRLIQGSSPFRADRQHIHYRLVDAGLTHLQSTATLLAVSLLMILLSFVLKGLGDIPVILVLLVLTTALSFIPAYILKKKNR